MYDKQDFLTWLMLQPAERYFSCEYSSNRYPLNVWTQETHQETINFSNINVRTDLWVWAFYNSMDNSPLFLFGRDDVAYLAMRDSEYITFLYDQLRITNATDIIHASWHVRPSFD